jgi:uncharacterized protein YdeI (YjbR/CyaY-like superfamily)
MGKRDSRVDKYIEKSADFAKPILKHLREVVHDAVPEVTETIKWGMPSFEYKGMLVGMAAFKKHAALHIRRGAKVVDRAEARVGEAMGQFGKLTKLSHLPSKRVLTGYLKKAKKLNETGVKTVKRAAVTAKSAAIEIPADLAAALKKSRKAMATFEKFSASAQKEYVSWIKQAKRPETRVRRVAITVEWLEEGKQRDWHDMKR